MEWVALGIVTVAIITVAILIARAKDVLRRQAGDLNKAWSDIEVLLKRQNDNLPRLLQTCRAYMPGQQDALRRVTESRAAYPKAKSIPEKAAREAALRKALQDLYAQAVHYPELKANSTFSQLQNELLEIEEKIEDRREIFNDDVRRFNRRLAGPLNARLAAKMKLRPHALFEASEEPMNNSQDSSIYK